MMIASGHGNGTARVWELATGEPVATLEGAHTRSDRHGGPFSGRVKAGHRQATDRKFRVWDLASRTSLLEREEFGNEVYAYFDTPLVERWPYGADSQQCPECPRYGKFPAGG